ncbi:mechanosensitive ion channel family protein [Nocardioides abyssi]|uniref:Mechanosensitive ion channel n=1 Tax=Nocardioides abyssi TaxID=3058370 RepID=A0ABT8EUV1_9ACTN|nr:mechanosensitive ion channel domain-containing protein [Nocardioides abyssi]MDN4161933.1 mechanosensitive ion channel [Nocardioides abyssi]
MDRWSDDLAAGGAALAVALLVIALSRVAATLLGRRWEPAAHLHRVVRIPFRVLVLVLAVRPVLHRVERSADADWGWLHQTERVLTVLAVGWLLTAAVLFVEDLGLRRNRTDVPDNRHARRLRTQVLIVRRLTIAAGVVVVTGAVLLSFPGVEAVGASVLASAGLLSVVAAVAAQSTLSNVFAGLQLAFSDAVRIDDVVIVDEEWGWIEEITLSYVVVRAWDDRRLVLPCTYFTTTPFQNWTRHRSELLGAVELDVDWRVDVASMRDELDRVLDRTELWDGRVKVLQVTDAVGGWIRVRALVTAADAARLFDLRCLVREQLVAWVRDHEDAGLPRQRVELVDRPTPPAAYDVRPTSPDDTSSGLFHGDDAADARADRRGGRSRDEPLGDPGADSADGGSDG